MRNYIKHFLVVTLIITLPTLIFSLWVGPIWNTPFQADLTRIGKWAANDFGPNDLHPSINVKESGKLITSPDVLVLGDSFSARNLWQSTLSDKTGLNIKTFHFDNNCITNWISTIVYNNSARIIMIETAERSFVGRFSQIEKCNSAKLVPLEVKAEKVHDQRPIFWPPTLSLRYLIPTFINTIELNVFPEKKFIRFDVVNTSLRNNCANFSNRRNDRFLYYASDDQKKNWSDLQIKDAISNILTIQKEVEKAGKKFFFVVAPDKSSVYKSCLLETNSLGTPNIVELLDTSDVNSLDLLTPLKKQINSTSDLYNPDNTHWSTSGNILVGTEINIYLSTNQESYKH